MRKQVLLVAFICLCFIANAQLESAKQTFKAANFKESINSHKTVAIIPFHVSIAYKRMPKGMDVEGVRTQEKNEGINMQQGMYTYLLRKAKDYTVTFQDVDRTNALLKRSGYYDRLDEVTADSLCVLLGVDAVIKCNYAYEKTGSEAGAIAKTLLFGVGGKTGSGALTMQIYNKPDGGLLWRFYKEMNEGAFSSANELMERMMRKVARNFPYEN
jgi:hypothetical protein